MGTFAQANGVPLLAPTSGASSLHDSATYLSLRILILICCSKLLTTIRRFNNYVVNVRASILDEVIASISFLTNLKRVFRISYLVSDDSYGMEVANAVTSALAYAIPAYFTIERNRI